MANLMNNRLSVTLTAAQVTAVKTAFTAIQTQLNFLIGLTAEERQSLPKIDGANKIFTEDCLLEMTNNSNMLPPFLVAAEVQKDLTLFEQLDEFVALSNQLHEKLRDTQMLAGSEAYSVCLKAYDAFMNAADSGVPGADAVYQHLKTRFAQRGGNNNHSTPPVI